MIWLVMEIWILLILAIGLGVVLGWFIATRLGAPLRPRRRMSEVLLLPDVRSEREEEAPMSAGSAPPETASDEIRRAPQGDDGEPRPEGPDLLQRLPGLGPSIETRLHQLGIFHFDQIAGMSPGEAEWLDAQLGGAGRVRFENWVEEAGRLSREMARRA